VPCIILYHFYHSLPRSWMLICYNFITTFYHSFYHFFTTLLQLFYHSFTTFLPLVFCNPRSDGCKFYNFFTTLLPHFLPLPYHYFTTCYNSLTPFYHLQHFYHLHSVPDAEFYHCFYHLHCNLSALGEW
jgi:hypothetical protein